MYLRGSWVVDLMCYGPADASMLFDGTKIHGEMSRLSLQLVFNTTLLNDDDELAKHGVTSILNKRVMEW